MRGLAHRRAVVPLAVAVVGDEAVVARDLGDAVAMLVARGVRLVDVSLSGDIRRLAGSGLGVAFGADDDFD